MLLIFQAKKGKMEEREEDGDNLSIGSDTDSSREESTVLESSKVNLFVCFLVPCYLSHENI